MDQATMAIPTFPPLLGRAIGVLPLFPLSLSMTAFSKRIARQHPGLFRRLGEHAQARFILDPTDLPFVICLEPNSGAPRMTALRGPSQGDTRIAGPMAALLGLVHGAFDGDALFFSRDLLIEGDTGGALALRNAVDDAELDIAAELESFSGPLARPLRQVIDTIERRTGVCLSRSEEDKTW